MSISPDSSLPFGVYETPITSRIRERMEETLNQHPAAGFGIGRSSDQEAQGRYTSAVSQHIGSLLEHRLRSLKSPEDRVALINTIALLLGDDEGIDSEELLYAVYNSGLADPPLLPDVSLTKSALFTNARGESSLTSEIEREIKTADSVDLLCAFIKNSALASSIDSWSIFAITKSHSVFLLLRTAVRLTQQRSSDWSRSIRQT